MAFRVPHIPFQTKVLTVVSPTIGQAVADYLTANPPTGGPSIDQIKADTQIAGAITNSHASGSDNQDLSGKMNTTAFSGLQKITVGASAPVDPATGDLWIDTN